MTQFLQKQICKSCHTVTLKVTHDGVNLETLTHSLVSFCFWKIYLLYHKHLDIPNTWDIHNQLSSIVSQLGISIAVISWILQQDVSRVFPWKLGQIGHSMTILDAAQKGDSKTPPTCLIWWSFGVVIWG